MIYILLLGAVFVVGGICIALAATSFSEIRTGLIVTCLGLFIAVLALLFMPFAAHARDPDGRYAQSPLKPWFDQLKSGKGLCCSNADGVALTDPDWDVKSQHYRVRIDGEWLDVPEDAVITEPNRAGQTMVWPYRENGKVKNIRCFLPGTMG